LAVFAAVWAIGSRTAQREVCLDEPRVRDLSRIARAVGAHVEQAGALPVDPQVLAKQPGQRLSLGDPVGGQAYGYRRLGGDRCELCGEFTTDTSDQLNGSTRRVADDWLHGRGRHCFQRVSKAKQAPLP